MNKLSLSLIFKKISCRARAGYALTTNRQTHSDIFACADIKSERLTQPWRDPERLARREFGEAPYQQHLGRYFVHLVVRIGNRREVYR